MNDIKSRENSARRQLTKVGMTLRKTPSRSKFNDLYGPGCTVINVDNNTVVLGANQHAFEATLEEVEEFLAAA